MARGPQNPLSKLLSVTPAKVDIGHVQLRDLIICPQEKGLVNYVHGHSIVEHDIHSPENPLHIMAELAFVPNTIAAHPVHDSGCMLLAAGGQDAEIHLSLHAPRISRSEPGRRIWPFNWALPGSINNSVLLTSLSMARSHESSIEPRLVISNNDCTVKFYDVPVRGESTPKGLALMGTLRLDVPVNHSSISPDGRILLSVGDSSKVHLHRLTGGARVAFGPMASLTVPPPEHVSSSALAASFSTAFSSNGSKFAVASQEGVIAVWDVRSTKPLKVFQTDKTRLLEGRWREGNGMASGFLSDDPWEWTRSGSKAPGWGARSVKFGAGGHFGNPGHEIMAFTEHTSLLHVVDARTFETEEIARVPSSRRSSYYPSPSPLRYHSRSRSASPGERQPTLVPSPRHYVDVRPRPSSRTVLALEETFRVPVFDESAARRRFHERRSSEHDTEDDEGIVIIPPLGDRDTEEDVRALLGHHGFRARQSSSLPSRALYEVEEHVSVDSGPDYMDAGHEDDDDMEVDQLDDVDCVEPLHATPSRSSSPTPSTARMSPSQPSMAGIRSYVRRDGHVHDVPAGLDHDADADLDLAGLCFDPTGAWLYVATVNGVAEWGVRGARKRWWDGSQWA